MSDGTRNATKTPENGTDTQNFRQKTACRSGEGGRKEEGEKERKRGRGKEEGRERDGEGVL